MAEPALSVDDLRDVLYGYSVALGGALPPGQRERFRKNLFRAADGFPRGANEKISVLLRMAANAVDRGGALADEP